MSTSPSIPLNTGSANNSGVAGSSTGSNNTGSSGANAAGNAANSQTSSPQIGQNSGGGLINVVSDYKWTINNVEPTEIPYVKLIEHKIDQSLLARNLDYYSKTVAAASKGAVGAGKSADLETVYDGTFTKNPTGNTYIFPYFNKSAFEVTTQLWDKIDAIGDVLNEAGNVLDDVASATNGSTSKAGKFINIAAKGTKIAGEYGVKAVSLGLKASNPNVNMIDRPRVFTSHNERTLTIQFPLYNTISPSDFPKNFELWQLFARSNLFEKTGPVTGIPPVWYEVIVPGQYYSYASCVTNIQVNNLGNMRIYDNKIIPDAFEFIISLTEMVMPSKNQFDKIYNNSSSL